MVPPIDSFQDYMQGYITRYQHETNMDLCLRNSHYAWIYDDIYADVSITEIASKFLEKMEQEIAIFMESIKNQPQTLICSMSQVMMEKVFFPIVSGCREIFTAFLSFKNRKQINRDNAILVLQSTGIIVHEMYLGSPISYSYITAKDLIHFMDGDRFNAYLLEIAQSGESEEVSIVSIAPIASTREPLALATDAPTHEPLATDAPTHEPLATNAPTHEPLATNAPTREPLTMPIFEPLTTDVPTREPLTADELARESDFRSLLEQYEEIINRPMDLETYELLYRTSEHLSLLD